MFEHFRASLYEDRWHEVVIFLRAVQKRLVILLMAWDEEKYIRGVDYVGAHRPAQKAREEQEISSMGITSFDPKAVYGIVESSGISSTPMHICE